MPAKTAVKVRSLSRACGGKRVRNRLLLSMPESEYQVMRPYLEFVELPGHRCLHEPHQRVDYLYFPNEGFISLVIAMKDGKTVEAGLVGNEGVAGMPALLGLSKSPLREVVQIAGDGFRIRLGILKDILRSMPHLQAELHLFAAGLAMQVAQTAACNRLHQIEHRLARWLLMAQDRVESGFLPITHDFLATMLGTDRPSVSLAAGVLQRKHLIQYRRGSVKIVSRKKLEKFTCECYAVVQEYAGDKKTITHRLALSAQTHNRGVPKPSRASVVSVDFAFRERLGGPSFCLAKGWVLLSSRVGCPIFPQRYGRTRGRPSAKTGYLSSAPPNFLAFPLSQAPNPSSSSRPEASPSTALVDSSSLAVNCQPLVFRNKTPTTNPVLLFPSIKGR